MRLILTKSFDLRTRMNLRRAKNPVVAAACCIALGLALLLAFCLSPSWVDEAGFLHEQFGLLPLGWLSVALGLIIGAVGLLLAAVGKSHKQD